jgi:hypothetical protein
MSNFKIHSVNNLMPAEIKYEDNGQLKTLIGYINYKTQELFCVLSQEIVSPDSDLANDVSEYLKDFMQSQAIRLDRPIPPEIGEKMQKAASYKVEDYIPSNLTLELVKAKDGKGKH